MTTTAETQKSVGDHLTPQQKAYQAACLEARKKPIPKVALELMEKRRAKNAPVPTSIG